MIGIWLLSNQPGINQLNVWDLKSLEIVYQINDYSFQTLDLSSDDKYIAASVGKYLFNKY
jgi:hypothetical protein